jgi:hypothetical protein
MSLARISSCLYSAPYHFSRSCAPSTFWLTMTSHMLWGWRKRRNLGMAHGLNLEMVEIEERRLDRSRSRKNMISPTFMAKLSSCSFPSWNSDSTVLICSSTYSRCGQSWEIRARNCNRYNSWYKPFLLSSGTSNWSRISRTSLVAFTNTCLALWPSSPHGDVAPVLLWSRSLSHRMTGSGRGATKLENVRRTLRICTRELTPQRVHVHLSKNVRHT